MKKYLTGKGDEKEKDCKIEKESRNLLEKAMKPTRKSYET